MTEADTVTLINELQLKIDQLPTKGTLKALEFRLDAILQANLDTFWLLVCAILVFLMQSGFMCLESGLSRNKNSINVALKNVTDFGIAVVTFWAFGFALMYGTSVMGCLEIDFIFSLPMLRDIKHTLFFKQCSLLRRQLLFLEQLQKD